jgi:hypothetical protein
MQVLLQIKDNFIVAKLIKTNAIGEMVTEVVHEIFYYLNAR